MNSTSFDDLQPVTRAKALLWDGDMKKAVIDYIVTCVRRSASVQDALYTEGRTVPGRHATPERPMGLTVTNAKGGESPHQFGYAFDFVIMVNGKPDWTGTSEQWYDAISLAQDRGLQSLRPMESAHLQEPNWKTLSMETRV